MAHSRRSGLGWLSAIVIVLSIVSAHGGKVNMNVQMQPDSACVAVLCRVGTRLATVAALAIRDSGVWLPFVASTA